MIIIPDDKFNQIMTCMGYPFITEKDLEIDFTQIKEMLISQAVLDYYRWFPIESYTTVEVATTFEIPFPSPEVFSVKDLRIATRKGGAQITGNAFVDERMIQSTGGKYGRGMYGTRNGYGFETAMISRRAEVQSTIDSNKAFKWRVLENQKKITGFTNVVGTVEIVWAAWSEDWQYVAFSRQNDVIKLCQAKILDYFGRLRQQQSVPDAPVELNGEVLIERAKELNEEVYNKWKSYTTPILMRG
jgi:hypothetical protein